MIQELQEENQHLRQQSCNEPKPVLTLRWKLCEAARRTMMRGAATECGNIAYFRRAFSSKVQSHNSDTEKWSTFPKCPTNHFSLTVVNGLVTECNLVYTNTLFSLMKEGGKQKWVDYFKCMPTKCKFTAVICNGKVLVVAGVNSQQPTSPFL